MTTRSASCRRKTPTGREEVAAAILEAATDLFAERGPAATSIRDIAARSKVNHGLVFRHFGTKDQLVGAVLDHLGATSTALLRRPMRRPRRLERALDRQMRVMARTLLDGYPAGQLQTRFPGHVRAARRVRPRHDDDRSARLALANAAALQFGWRLFAPFLRSADRSRRADGRRDARGRCSAEMARIVEPWPSPSVAHSGSIWKPGGATNNQDLPVLLAHYGIQAAADQTTTGALEQDLAPRTQGDRRAQQRDPLGSSAATAARKTIPWSSPASTPKPVWCT